MTYTFTKALGGKIGISLCEDDKLDLALDLIAKAKANNVNLVLAVDAKIAKDLEELLQKHLASYADCYVNDAFGTAHRAHASTALIANYFDADNKMFGFLMNKEVVAVEKVMKDINRPFTAIMVVLKFLPRLKSSKTYSQK